MRKKAAAVLLMGLLQFFISSPVQPEPVCRAWKNKRSLPLSRLISESMDKPTSLEIGFKGFSNLESLVLESPSRRQSTCLKISPRVMQLPEQTGQAEQESSLKINLERVADYGLKAIIPGRDLLGKDSELRIYWIDAYR